MISRKALIIGIDYYKNFDHLQGCANDARNVNSVLRRHSDGTKNFDIKFRVARNKQNNIKKKSLKDDVKALFKYDSDVALFYFSGHGYIDTTGGYLITSDCETGDDGLPMSELLIIINESKAKNKIIILDCCHSGEFANLQLGNKTNSILSEGTTVLAASGKDEYAIENNGRGVFTTLFVDAMNGNASDLMGNITPSSIYAHVDQSFGAWEQRPIFKTNVKTFTSLRTVQPPIDLVDLKKITKLFPKKGENFKLDQSFEPESKNPNPKNVRKFKILQKYNRVNLVVPVDAEHMYFAAMEGKSCKLTVLGEHYWNLVKKEKI